MSTIAQKWDEAFEATRSHVKEHHLNHAYLEGFQWMDWNPVELQVQGLPDDSDRIQATMNHMRSNMRTLISQLTQRELSFDNAPSAYDDATIRAAKIAETVIFDTARRHEWEVKREAHIKATMKGGTAIVAVDWSVTNQTTVETVLGVPEFTVEPGARDAQTARWWIKLQLLPPGEVRSMFPTHFEEDPPADGRLGMASEYEYRDRAIELTRVLTYYERPNPLQPKGRVLVEVDNKTVEAIEWPFPWSDSLNFASARESLIENEAFGSTILSDVRSPQTALNAAWSGALEHLRESSTHRVILDQSWADQADTLSDRAGQPLIGRIEKGAPQYMKAPGLPQGTLDMISLLQAEIDNLMGVHDVSRGQAPANIESGYGLSILAEKDSSPVGRLIKETARVWSRVAWMVAELHQTEVTSKRTTTIHDGAGPVRREWKGSDIMGQTDLRVPLDAIIPKSRAAQAEWAGQAVQMGLINPEDPLAVMRYAKLADMPDQRGIINATLPDVAKAIRENEMVVMDEIPIPRDFDDHPMHIEIHNEMRKSAQYELMTDQQRTDLDNHVKTHEQMNMEAMGQQAMGEQLDPRLAGAARADGNAPLEPLPPEMMMPEEAPEQEPLDADSMVEDMMGGMDDL